MTNPSLNHSNDLFDNPVGLDGLSSSSEKKTMDMEKYTALFESMEHDQITWDMINPQKR